MCEIKNTVKFTFPNGSEKPEMGEIIHFAKALDSDPSQMEAIYRIAEEKSLFIEFRSEEAMKRALTFNLVFHYGNGKQADVHMSHAGEYIQYVRVYDLPPEVGDHELAVVLGKYGKVKRVVREKFPAELCFDICTGVRGVYMHVDKQIPTSLHFLNRKGNIYYDGNKDKCFLCKKDGHTQRKPRKASEGHQQQQPRRKHISSEEAGAVMADPNETANADDGLEEEMVMDPPSPDPANDSSTEVNGTPKLVFKHPNDEYYFRKFGIMDFAEKQEKKRLTKEKEPAEAARQVEIKSPSKKIKKNS